MNIALIPREVQWAALRKYVDKCQELHAMAFMQWRYEFPNKIKYDKQ